MSAGCVHQRASIALAGGFLLGQLAFGSPGIEYAIGSLVGILISPDLDVDAGNISNTIIRNRLGTWAERGWSLLWGVYRGSVKHGSPLSHFPVISTLARIGYLYLMLIIIPYGVMEIVAPGAWNIWDEFSWWIYRLVEHWQLIVGLMGSDLIHYVLDILTKESNGSNKRRNQCPKIGPPIWAFGR
jgi:uncharacterized metal-binding protein